MRDSSSRRMLEMRAGERARWMKSAGLLVKQITSMFSLREPANDAVYASLSRLRRRLRVDTVVVASTAILARSPGCGPRRGC